MKPSTNAIILAGGQGSRMNASCPKQFLSLKGRPLFSYSLELFLSLKEISTLIIVADPSYYSLFAPYTERHSHIVLAPAGERRQDSLFNGMKRASSECQYFCIHDAARPLVTLQSIQSVLQEGYIHGAAVLGTPVKQTIKEGTPEGFVKQTLNRERLWEIQTPQVVRRDLLERGFSQAIANDLTVTDDVSLVELLNCPVKLVKGCSQNIKITTPEDLKFVNSLL